MGEVVTRGRQAALVAPIAGACYVGAAVAQTEKNASMTTSSTLADLLGAVSTQGARALFDHLTATPADDTPTQRLLRRASHRVARGGVRALLQAAVEEGGAVAAEARLLAGKAAKMLVPTTAALSPALVQVREFPEGTPNFVACLADGRWLVSAFLGPWLGRLEAPPTVAHPRREVTSSRTAAPQQVQPFADGFVGFTSRELLILEAETLAVARRLPGGPKGTSEKLLCLAAGATALFTGDSEGVVRRVDAAGTLSAAKTKHAGAVHHIALSADGARLVTVAADGVRVWSTTGAALEEVLFHAEKAVRCVGFTAEGVPVAAVDRLRDDVRALLVFGDDEAPIRIALPHAPRELVALPEGRVVVACEDGPLVVVDLARARPIGLLLGHGPKPGGLAYSPQLGLVGSTSADGSLRVWEVEKATPVAPVPRIVGLAAGGVSLLVQTEDGVRFTAKDRTVEVEVSGEELIVAPSGALAVVRDGQTLQLLSPGGATRDVELPVEVQQVAFLPSGLILAAGPDGAAWVDPAKGKVAGEVSYSLVGDVCALGTMSEVEARVISRGGSSVRLSPGKKNIDMRSEKFALDDAADPQFVLGPDEVAALGSMEVDGQVYASLLTRARFPGGEVVATWPKVQKVESASYPQPVTGASHLHGGVVALAAVGGNTIAVGSHDGTLRVISLDAGEELLRYDADNALCEVAAGADGRFYALEVSGRLIQLDAPREG